MIERNPITGDPVIIATGRSGRPNIFRNGDEPCPFCAGNEALTPPEICRAGDPWRVRVFPNKYPATEHHEVAVESPDHAATFDRITHAEEVVRIYVDRFQALARTAASVSIFKNHGAMAGASIPHLHSQIIGTPFIPPRIARELQGFLSHCPLCSSTDWLIAETPNYRWIAPPGSIFAYEQWIVPKRHSSQVSEPAELSQLLQRSAKAMQRLSDSFNWIFVNFPRDSRGHWYVQLFPRLAVHAGFELGTGSAINVIEPRAAAQLYRQSWE